MAAPRDYRWLFCLFIDGNGDICFIYEDHGVHFRLGSQPTEMYDILYRHLSLQDITGGRYQYRAAK